MSLRLAILSIVRNEADIIESFVRHHAGLVDRHYILDNFSADATPAIVEKLAAEGLAVTLERDTETGPFYQGRKTVQLLRRAQADGDYDFFILLDGDEFLTAASRETLEAELAAVEPPLLPAIRLHEYVADLSDDLEEVDPVRRLRHVGVVAQPAIHVVVPSWLAQRDDVTIADGNHGAGYGGTPLPTRLLATIGCAHFAIRSPAQLVSKLVVGLISWKTRVDNAGGGMGFHMLGAFQRLKESGALDRAQFVAESRRYNCADADVVLQPFQPNHGRLCHTAAIGPQPYAAVCDAVERLAEWVQERRAMPDWQADADDLAHRYEALKVDHAALLRSRSRLAKAFVAALVARLTRRRATAPP